MYGKVMSLHDGLIVDYFELVTDVPDEELEVIREECASGAIDPMKLKKRLAREIVAQFHGSEAAQAADEHFTRVHQQGELPEVIPDLRISGASLDGGRFMADLGPALAAGGYVKSNSDFKRLVSQGAVEVDGEKVAEARTAVCDGSVVKVGRRTFVRIRIV
jgi:tyrosyl-tRNA synthetase